MQQSVGEREAEVKKPRRSQRLSSQVTPLKDSQLPSPLTHEESTLDDIKPESTFKEGTVTPPEGRPSQIRHRTPVSSDLPTNGLSSPPADTQPFSQLQFPLKSLSYEVEDEEGEGVWGYLIPLDHNFGDTLVLRRRTACPNPKAKAAMITDGKKKVGRTDYGGDEQRFEDTKINGVASGGYLIGRHPECGKSITVFMNLNFSTEIPPRSDPERANDIQPTLPLIQ